MRRAREAQRAALHARWKTQQDHLEHKLAERREQARLQDVDNRRQQEEQHSLKQAAKRTLEQSVVEREEMMAVEAHKLQKKRAMMQAHLDHQVAARTELKAEIRRNHARHRLADMSRDAAIAEDASTRLEVHIKNRCTKPSEARRLFAKRQAQQAARAASTSERKASIEGQARHEQLTGEILIKAMTQTPVEAKRARAKLKHNYEGRRAQTSLGAIRRNAAQEGSRHVSWMNDDEDERPTSMQFESQRLRRPITAPLRERLLPAVYEDEGQVDYEVLRSVVDVFRDEVTGALTQFSRSQLLQKTGTVQSGGTISGNYLIQKDRRPVIVRQQEPAVANGMLAAAQSKSKIRLHERIRSARQRCHSKQSSDSSDYVEERMKAVIGAWA